MNRMRCFMRDLILFYERHSDTDEDLYLFNLDIIEGTWKSAFQMVKDFKCLRLCRVQQLSEEALRVAFVGFEFISPVNGGHDPEFPDWYIVYLNQWFANIGPEDGEVKSRVGRLADCCKRTDSSWEADGETDDWI